jgi:transcriptional regulator with XRE-family HTH domain
MMTYKKITIKDVALAAGVSTQTISRVLNNRPDVSSDTRDRILHVITELNYSPSLLARRMRRNNDRIGVAADGSNLNGALAASSDELQVAIEGALANGVLAQEKAVWLLQGLEKGFITDGCIIYLPVGQNENHNNSVCL